MRHLITDLMVRHGYEVPKTTSKATLAVLKQLRTQKVVIFVCDDGPSRIVRDELVAISDNIGLEYFGNFHRIILVDDSDDRLLVDGVAMQGLPELK